MSLQQVCRTEVRFLAMVALTAAAARAEVPGLVISEVDYDQPGTDNHEWIEIQNTLDFEIQARGLHLVLYDGDLNGSCQEYCDVDLTILQVIPEGSYIVIGAQPCAVLPLCTSTDAIHNTVPGGMAIVGPHGVIDSVEYGSDLIHSTCNFNLIPLRDRDSQEGSLQFCIQSTPPYNGTWSFDPTPTPCAASDCTATDVPFAPARWGSVKSLYK